MEDIQSEWWFSRQLTRDLLSECSDRDLLHVLTPASGPMWKQFRHIGRVHENYLSALQSDQIEFNPASGSYHAGASGPDLNAYFEGLEKRHNDIFSKTLPESKIIWFGEQISPRTHLVRLLTHETLHHGQLILYWRSLGNPFPKSWASWGEE